MPTLTTAVAMIDNKRRDMMTPKCSTPMVPVTLR
jgi:hypothetical protein